MSTQEKIEKMLKKAEVILAAGGEKRVAKQHESGKMTARERIAALLDEGSFVELDRFVRHRCYNFGQEKKELPGEGHLSGWLPRRVTTSSSRFITSDTLVGWFHPSRSLSSLKKATRPSLLPYSSFTAGR